MSNQGNQSNPGHQSDIDEFRQERNLRVDELEAKLGADHPQVVKAKLEAYQAIAAYEQALLDSAYDDLYDDVPVQEQPAAQKSQAPAATSEPVAGAASPASSGSKKQPYKEKFSPRQFFKDWGLIITFIVLALLVVLFLSNISMTDMTTGSLKLAP